jgi:Na+-driven multidrug efflux pump
MSTKRILLWAAALSVFALVAHSIDAPDHLKEWWGYGTVFIMTAAFQFFYGLALFIQPWKYDEEGNLRSRAESYGRKYYLLGVGLTTFAVIFYVVTRTSGLPFLVAEARAEPVTLLSLISLIANVPLVTLLIILVQRSGAARVRA